jgi:diadenylate cyclase
MLSYTTLQTIIQLVRTFFDILILWVLLYYTIKIVRNNSRTAQIFKGIVLILIIRAVANFFGLKAVDWLAGVLVTYGFLAIIIIFQPEIRSVLERLGKSSVFSRLNTLSSNERMRLVDELVNASMALSQNRMGALISIEQGHSLSDFIKTGTIMNSLVTAELLQTIFVPSTPLHDGAVIIQGDRIACASAYFPPTNFEVPSRYGARHRAAIGISEITDSVTIIISEKSGRISIAEEGKLITMNQITLRAYLERVILQDESDVYETEPSRILLPQPRSEDKSESNENEQTHSAQPKATVKREGFFKTLFKPPLNPIDVVVETKKSDEHKTQEENTQKQSFFSRLFKKKTNDLTKEEGLNQTLENLPETTKTPDEKPKRTRIRKVKAETSDVSSSGLENEETASTKDTPKGQINLEFSVSDASLLDDIDDRNGGENA